MNSKAISKQEHRELTNLSAVRTIGAVLADLGAIAVLMLLAIWSTHPLVIAVVIIFIARQQHALAILVHEGVHRRLFPSRRLNDIVARWLLAGPLFVSYDGYRRTHIGHHVSTMTADDPDILFVAGLPVSRGEFSKSLLADIVGVSYLMLLLHYWRHGSKEFSTRAAFLGSLVPPIVVNGVLFLILTWSGYGWCYFVCWLAPLFFVFPLLLHLRGICEHGGHEPDPDPMRCTWTVINPVETFFIAPHNINYHMEHHAYPAVPQFNLPRLHRLLLENGTLPVENVHRSYMPILKNLIVAR